MSLKGGEKLQAYLASISDSLKNARGVKVGFLEDADYPPTDSERFIARMQKIHAQGREAKALARRPLLTPGGRIVNPKPRKQRIRRMRMADIGVTRILSVAQVAFWNEFGTTTAPPRPFFRNMIAKHSGDWSDQFATVLKQSDYDASSAFQLLGKLMQEQLRTSINEWPGDNAPLTIALKGFNKGLIDSGTMLRSVDYEVME